MEITTTFSSKSRTKCCEPVQMFRICSSVYFWDFPYFCFMELRICMLNCRTEYIRFFRPTVLPIIVRIIKIRKMIFLITIPDCTSRGKREVVFLPPQESSCSSVEFCCCFIDFLQQCWNAWCCCMEGGCSAYLALEGSPVIQLCSTDRGLRAV